MRILYLTEQNLFESNNGTPKKDYSTILALSREHELFVVNYSDKNTDKLKIEEFNKKGIKIEFVDPKNRKYIKKKPNFGIMLKSKNYVPELDHTVEMENAFNRIIKIFSPDIVHVSSFAMTGYVDLARPNYNIVYDTDTVNYLRFRDYLKKENLITSWSTKDYAVRILNHEAKMILNSKAVFVVSELIRSTTHSRFQNINPIYVVPFGVDINKIDYIPPSFSNKNIIFICNGDFKKTQEILKAYVRDIHLKLLNIYPDYKLLVFNGSNKNYKGFGNISNIEFLGDINEKASYPLIREASGVVIPEHTLNNSYSKIISAFAMGLPVVSKEQIIDSIDVTNGEHLLTAKDSEDFVIQVSRLFNDKDLVFNITKNARALVEEKYTKDRMAENILNCYKKIEQSLSDR